VEFAVAVASGVPIYQQISEQICAGIARGRLIADERLPSVRELSQSLVVNPNTVARAYTELERDGTLYTRPGTGVFVSPMRALASKAERGRRIEKLVDMVLINAVRLGCTFAEVIELLEERSGGFQWQDVSAESSSPTAGR
jgi:GntR family transcriptional regulator